MQALYVKSYGNRMKLPLFRRPETKFDIGQKLYLHAPFFAEGLCFSIRQTGMSIMKK